MSATSSPCTSPAGGRAASTTGAPRCRPEPPRRPGAAPAAALVAVVAGACFGAHPLLAQLPARDSTLEVLELAFDTARLGENPLRVRVRNRGDSTVLAVLDLRAVPGMWLRRNIQRQVAVELPAGGERVIEGSYLFPRMSQEATLRVTVGPGERLAPDIAAVRRISFRETFPVGRDSPDAYDPATDFTIARRGPLEIYAWKGSLAERRLEAIAKERQAAVRAVAELLAVDAPDRIRLVFYADEPTKIEQTGHHGVGWAVGTMLVEVYNDSVRMDPYHELAHVVAEAAGSPPPALAEGFAIYASDRLGGDALRALGDPGGTPDTAVCELRGTASLIPLSELLALDDIGRDADRAGAEYAEAGSFVAYLAGLGGLPLLRRAYGALSDEADPAENRRRLRGLYGAGVEELEAGWLERVSQRCAPGSGSA